MYNQLDVLLRSEMIKAVLKYLLSPCIFLLIGHGPIHAHASGDGMQSTPQKTAEIPAPAEVYIMQDNQATEISFVPAGAEKESLDLRALMACDDNDDKDDDDESFSLKKHAGSGHYCASVFLTPASGSFLGSSTPIPTSNNNVSYTSFHRYIIFHSFRI